MTRCGSILVSIIFNTRNSQVPVVQKWVDKTIHLAPVVQTGDSAIHWINHYLVDNAIGLPTTYPQDKHLYPLDSAISFPNTYPMDSNLAPVVQTLDSAIHRINHYPMFQISITKINCVHHWIVLYLGPVGRSLV